MTTPAVSVIVNCHNGVKYLREAIDSVYQQRFQDWEIVFWDNASTDASEAVVRAYDSRLRYFRSPDFLLLGAARNAALAVVRGDFIAFLDADDVWLPEKLTRQLALFTSPEVALVYSNCYYVNERAEPFGDFFQKHPPYRGRVLRRLIDANFIAFSTAIVRTSTIADVGGFDDSLEIAEDYDFFLRICAKHAVEFDAHPLALYRVHGGNLHHEFDRHYEESIRVYARLLGDGDRWGPLPAARIRRALFAVWCKWAGRELIERRNISSAAWRFWQGVVAAGGLRAIPYGCWFAMHNVQGFRLMLKRRRRILSVESGQGAEANPSSR